MKKRVVQKLRMNQWPLEFFNPIELIDACAMCRERVQRKSYSRMLSVPSLLKDVIKFFHFCSSA